MADTANRSSRTDRATAPELPFTQVADVALFSPISPLAFRIFTLLTKRAGLRHGAVESRSTIAASNRVSIDTIDRAIAELQLCALTEDGTRWASQEPKHPALPRCGLPPAEHKRLERAGEIGHAWAGLVRVHRRWLIDGETTEQSDDDADAEIRERPCPGAIPTSNHYEVLPGVAAEMRPPSRTDAATPTGKDAATGSRKDAATGSRTDAAQERSTLREKEEEHTHTARSRSDDQVVEAIVGLRATFDASRPRRHELGEIQDLGAGLTVDDVERVKTETLAEPRPSWALARRVLGRVTADRRAGRDPWAPRRRHNGEVGARPQRGDSPRARGMDLDAGWAPAIPIDDEPPPRRRARNARQRNTTTQPEEFPEEWVQEPRR